MVPPGAWVLGRSTLADLRADDPTVEPFHLDVRLPVADGEPPSWLQLAGRRPVQPADDGLVAVGAGLVRLRRVPAPRPMRRMSGEREADDLGRHPGSVVVRSARGPLPTLDELAATPSDDDLSTGPDPSEDVGRAPDAATALVPALVTCAATGALAVAIGQPMLVAMAAVGGSVACVLWVLSWARHRRGARRAAAASTARTARVVAAAEHRRRSMELRHRLAHPGIEGARRLLDLTGDRGEVAPPTSSTPNGDDFGTGPGDPGDPGDPGAVAAPRGLWERRPWHPDSFVVVAGCGTVEVDDRASDLSQQRVVMPTASRSVVLEQVPIVVDVGPGARVACCGAFAEASVRSMLVQLATTTGPADWLLVVVSDRTDRAECWEWLRGLPHLVLADGGAVLHDDAAATGLLTSWLASGAGSSRPSGPPGRADSVGGADDAPVQRHVLVVTDDADSVAVRTSSIRRLLHARPDVALVGAFEDPGRVPAMCDTVVVTGSDGTVRVRSGDVSSSGEWRRAGGRGRLTGLGRDAAQSAVSVLSQWSDPEVPADDHRSLPTDVLLDEAMAARGTVLDRDAIVARWRRAGVDAPVQVPIGIAADGVVELDLVGDGPHGLIAGTTGSGKSELLRTVVVSSCASVPPEQLALVLVDFKGGATFDGLQALPHVVGLVTDLEPHLTDRVLRGLRAEVTSREHRLRSIGAVDLSAARAATGTSVVPRLVVIVDEFAALALDHPTLLHALVDVARRGRSLGVHLLLATQRPSGVVSDEIRTNTALRIALRLHDSADAVDVVGDPSPASFGRSSAGRAVMRLGPGELVTFQSARVAAVAATVGEIAAAARTHAGPTHAGSTPVGAPSRPWCDPLPERLDRLPDRPVGSPGTTSDHLGGTSSRRGSDEGADLGVDVGLVDLPDEQRQETLRWRPSDGHVLVVGAAGHGVTTTLASLAVRSSAVGSSAVGSSAGRAADGDASCDRELIVFDAHGDPRWDEIAALPQCAGVIRLHERERLDRALRRAAGPTPPGGRIVVIDGIALVRRDLEQPGRAEQHESFEALVLATPPGVTLLIGAHGAAGLSPAVVSRCARRWVLHLHDPAESGAFGLRLSDVPPPIAGRIIDAATSRQAQLLGWPVDEIATMARRGVSVTRIVALPEVVGAGDLPASEFDGETWSPVVGVGHRSLQPVALDVPAGDHLLVIGPSRSGRTELLSQLRRGWSEARPDAAQVVVCPRRLPAGARADAMGHALVDLHHELAAGRAALLVVDDAELVADPDGGLAALAAASPEGLVIVAACRPDAVRSHGHWVATLRRSRRGVLMSPASDLDADALGVTLPRHPPLPPRPGLCWLVSDGSAVLAQAATATP